MKRSLRYWHAAALYMAALSPLATWGLPDRSRDSLLFGGSPAWGPEEYDLSDAIRARRERLAGADVDLNPLDRSGVVELTATHEARAEILRRYRLFTRQPDEMITLMALQRMRPQDRDFDPRLYQYGGAYIYAVAGMLGAAHVLGWVDLTAPAETYLAAPERMAAFYLAGRLLSLIGGALLLAGVARLAERCGGRAAGWLALALTAASPVFITAALEAKPHGIAAGLLIWSAVWAVDYVERGKLIALVWSAVFSGLAFGAVLTGCLGAILVGGAWLARGWSALRNSFAVELRKLGLSALVFLGVYAATNPWVVLHLLRNRAALTGNLANTRDMYAVHSVMLGAWNVGNLLAESAGLSVLVGVAGFAIVWRSRRRAVLVVAGPAVVMLAIAMAVGAGKPAEYARFLLLPVILMTAAAGVAVARLIAIRPWAGWMLLAGVLLTLRCVPYWRSFAVDAAGANESRFAAGRFLAQRLAQDPGATVGLLQEPAPFSVPPMDFVHRRVILLPPRRPESPVSPLPEWLVHTDEGPRAFADAWWRPQYALEASFPPPNVARSPIAWANKPVHVWRRVEATKSEDGDS